MKNNFNKTYRGKPVVSVSSLRSIARIANEQAMSNARHGISGLAGLQTRLPLSNDLEIWFGKIVDTGPIPDGEVDPLADYEDERYWVKKCYCSKNTGDADEQLTFSIYAADHSDYLHITASNIAELNGGTHNVAADEYVVVFSFIQEQDNYSGADDVECRIKHYYFWRGEGSGTHTTPAVLYSTYEGDEEAQTDTWDISSQGANDGVAFCLTTRVVYKDSGDEILYGFYRVFLFNSIGRLVAISAETRYTIDAPEPCDADVDGGSW